MVRDAAKYSTTHRKAPTIESSQQKKSVLKEVTLIPHMILEVQLTRM